MYKLQNQSVKRISDGASIPMANGNRDYEEYKQWLAEGGIPEPEFTDAELLVNAKTSKASQIRQAYDTAVKAMVGDTDSTEMSSWTKQEAEARAWATDNLVATPIIDNLLLGRAMGETKEELVLKIIGKADMYAVAYAQVLGQYHSKQKLLAMALTIEEVEVV